MNKKPCRSFRDFPVALLLLLLLHLVLGTHCERAAHGLSPLHGKLVGDRDRKFSQLDRTLSSRSDPTATDLEKMMNTLSVRLDMMDEENLALRTELQTLRSENENLQNLLESVRHQVLVQPSPCTAASGPSTECPPCSGPEEGSGSELGASAAPSQQDVASLLTVQGEMGKLRDKVANHTLQLADLEHLGQTLSRTLSACTSQINAKVSETESKFHQIESQVLGLTSTQKYLNVSVPQVDSQTQQVQQILQALEQDSQSRQQSLRAMVDAVEQTIYALASQRPNDTIDNNNNHSSSTNLTSVAALPTVAVQVIGDAVDWPIPNNGHLIFPRVVANEGGAYHPSTGMFQAQGAGWYLFILQCGIRGDGANAQLSLMKNNAVAASATSLNSVVLAHTATFMNLHAVLHLDTNDTVWVSFTMPHHHEQPHLMPLYASSFIGLLIH